jgi:PAS domain S-box-containing protein
VEERAAEIIKTNQQLDQEITDRKRAEEELRQRNRDLELLNRAGRALTSTLDLDQVLVTVLEEVRRLLGVTACSVWLIDAETNELICRQAAGPESETVRDWRLVLGEGIVGWVARHGQSLIVPDTRADERHFTGVDRQAGLELRSILSVPLQVKQGVIGALEVLDTEVGRFTATDLKLAESLAATAAVAIENARLYEEADRLRAFNENIVQGIEEGICLLDEKGYITFMNRRGAALTGYVAEELVGRHWSTLVTSECMAQVEAEFAKRSQGTASQYEAVGLTRQGQRVPVIVSARPLFENERLTGVLCAFTDITERKQAEEERERLIVELQEALAKIKTLRGFIPICASCKKVRDDEGYWHQVEVYIRDHSEAEFSHGLCPDCLKKLYPEFEQGVGDD